MSDPIKHLVIPDCQVKPGVPLDHLTWAGKYIAEKRPNVIICLGDFADMASLSSYDVGKRSFEGRRLQKDIDAVQRGMDRLITPIVKLPRYNPRLVFCEGNHEERLERLTESDPKLHGFVGLRSLGYEIYGWKIYPFLKPVRINGVNYSHFFPSGVMKMPCKKAARIISKYHQSCVAGHTPGKDIAYAYRGDGKAITAVICGSFYQHDEEYADYLSNRHWRGLFMLHEVRDGQFDEMAVSLAHLKRRFGK